MYINKYGIIIKKLLNEKYPKKYEELQNKKILLQIIQNKQMEVVRYRKKLIEKHTPITKNKMIKIQDSINEKIDEIVEKIKVEKLIEN